MGDELSDDEYLIPNNEGVYKADIIEGDIYDEPASSDSDDDSDEELRNTKKEDVDDSKNGGDRKRKEPSRDEDTSKPAADAKSEPKKAKQTSNEQLIIDLGRSITSKGLNAHVAFFNAVYKSAYPLDPPANLAQSRFITHPMQSVTAAADLDGQFINFLKATVLSQKSGGSKRLKKHKSISPICIIISGGAKRSCEVLKTLSPLKTRVAKLFAKNMNIADQVTTLKTTANPFAVGTPNRILKLLQDGALDISLTEMIVVDCKEDQKGFNVVTMNDTKTDLMEIVRNYVVEKEQCKLCLY
jgi:superfamily II DNA/RNA helicase